MGAAGCRTMGLTLEDIQNAVGDPDKSTHPSHKKWTGKPHEIRYLVHVIAQYWRRKNSPFGIPREDWNDNLINDQIVQLHTTLQSHVLKAEIPNFLMWKRQEKKYKFIQLEI